MTNEGAGKLRFRVAICHPRLGWGGSEKRVMWGIEALKNDYDITLITAGQFNLDDLNRYYGTSILRTDFRTRQVSMPFFLRKNATAAALRWSFYQRFCRRVATEYDVLISTYGPCDFGVPAIHFVADFSWSPTIRKRLHPQPPGIVYREHLLRRCYLSFARVLSGASGRDVFSGEDVIVAVSDWVAKLMREEYNVECQVINSPVPGRFDAVPFEDKEPGFVCLGRIAPEKRVEESIAILKKVRRKGHKLHLHIIGAIENDSYGKRTKRLVKDNSEWVIHEGRLFEDDKIRMLTRHRFGIHACKGDAFPGAVVEMVKAGCITFVPNEGGQVDIVNHSALIYGDLQDAIDKIQRVLKDDALQTELQNHVAMQADMFSNDRFVVEIKDVVQEFARRYARQ